MATTFVDQHVGMKLRQRRTFMGLTQTDIGKPLGISFQQIQKYENGKNRISVSALLNFAKQLNVTIDYFVEGVPNRGRRMNAKDDPLTQRETLELVKTYYKMKPKHREAVRSFISSLTN